MCHSCCGGEEKTEVLSLWNYTPWALTMTVWEAANAEGSMCGMGGGGGDSNKAIKTLTFLYVWKRGGKKKSSRLKHRNVKIRFQE